MYGVELYAAVRLAAVDEGLSHHEAGRPFGIDRRTVKQMLSYSARVCPIICVSGAMGVALSGLSALRPESDAGQGAGRCCRSCRQKPPRVSGGTCNRQCRRDRAAISAPGRVTYIRHWEFETSLRRGPNIFSLPFGCFTTEPPEPLRGIAIASAPAMSADGRRAMS